MSVQLGTEMVQSGILLQASVFRSEDSRPYPASYDGLAVGVRP